MDLIKKSAFFRTRRKKVLWIHRTEKTPEKFYAVIPKIWFCILARIRVNSIFCKIFRPTFHFWTFLKMSIFENCVLLFVKKPKVYHGQKGTKSKMGVFQTKTKIVFKWMSENLWKQGVYDTFIPITISKNLWKPMKIMNTEKVSLCNIE